MSDEKKTPPEGSPASRAAPDDDGEVRMKECFGVSQGWFMEDLAGDYEDRKICFECSQFDACHKLMMLKNNIQLRFEIRRAAQVIGRAYGGSHSSRPFG
ncbi:MAG: hypothetical protein ACOCVL_03710 [Candidatus Sumerlaeota bacterium]